MSVPVRNRNLSAIEFIHTFNKLREYATDMLLTVRVTKEHEWLQNCWRSEMRYLLRKLGTAIEIANSIYITTDNDLYEKTKYLNIAIGLCNAIKDLLQEIMHRIKKFDGCMAVLGDMIKKEINLLKGVRRRKYKVGDHTASVETVSNSTNFCNVNNNGNANNNNASNADGGVRPDFGSK